VAPGTQDGSGVFHFGGMNCIAARNNPSVTGYATLSAGQSCTTVNNSYRGYCDETVNWPQSWPDNNYAPVCTGVSPSYASLKLDILSWDTNTVRVRVAPGTQDGSGVFHFGGMNCMGYEPLPPSRLRHHHRRFKERSAPRSSRHGKLGLHFSLRQ